MKIPCPSETCLDIGLSGWHESRAAVLTGVGWHDKLSEFRNRKGAYFGNGTYIDYGDNSTAQK